MISLKSTLYMCRMLGAAMERLDDLKSNRWTLGADERRYGPIANSAARGLAIILITAPWLTGAAWLTVYFSDKLIWR
jgi:hypothetical protein